MKHSHITLPIDSLKDKIISNFNNFSNFIIKASPGSGKTTRIPLFLLEILGNEKIYILEPRRLAAKLAAIQVANELGEKVGERVGYIFRYEQAVSEKTQVLFLTEGTFLKILAKNRTLVGVKLVILDEFHERHLSTDAALSFILKIQNEKRIANLTDLKLMIMSATIDSAYLENFLDLKITKTMELNLSRFPLKLEYLPNTTSIIQAPLAKKVKSALENIIDQNLLGDILVFFPGMKEIREAEALLVSLCQFHEFNLFVLHGDLTGPEQDQILQASNQRKIILATNIAESSITIPGIRIVIDSGLQKESSYNFYSGLQEVKITKTSKASAIQRGGRANREAAGFCFRIYAQIDFDQRPEYSKAEIEKSDLSELTLLSSHLFGYSLNDLQWLQAPPDDAMINANDLLLTLNAIDKINILLRLELKYLNTLFIPDWRGF